jgi:hypothetical protein
MNTLTTRSLLFGSEVFFFFCLPSAFLNTKIRDGNAVTDDIKMDLREIGRKCGLDSSGSGQKLVAGFCEHSNEPLGSIRFC